MCKVGLSLAVLKIRVLQLPLWLGQLFLIGGCSVMIPAGKLAPPAEHFFDIFLLLQVYSGIELKGL
jgi:hypothetical protein